MFGFLKCMKERNADEIEVVRENSVSLDFII